MTAYRQKNVKKVKYVEHFLWSGSEFLHVTILSFHFTMPCMLMPLPWPAVEVLTLRGQDSPSSWSWRLKPTARFDTSSRVWVFFFPPSSSRSTLWFWEGRDCTCWASLISLFARSFHTLCTIAYENWTALHYRSRLYMSHCSVTVCRLFCTSASKI